MIKHAQDTETLSLDHNDTIRRRRHLIVAILFAVFIAALFWSQSRVPALNEKAQMGLRTNFSAIAFDVALPVSPRQHIVERIARSAVNWGYTNWKGMTFGLLFAAAALTVLRYVRRRGFASPWLNTLAGIAAGAPLGVCTNCATPIAHGMYCAGVRLETALAVLFSSPTLNVIVVTMSFTLLPLALALTKLIAVLATLALIPFFVGVLAPNKLVAPPQTQQLQGHNYLSDKPLDDEIMPIANADSIHGGLGWGTVVWSTLLDYTRNLAYIFKVALPLMLLAGVLGAAVVELINFERLPDDEPTLLLVSIVAIIATLLPVPIAFDVIVVNSMLAAGVSTGIAMAALFALGIYSIYPAAVIARYISVKLSIGLGLAVAIIAVICSVVASEYSAAKEAADRAAIAAGLEQNQAESPLNIAAVHCAQLAPPLQFSCLSNFVLKAATPERFDCQQSSAINNKSVCESLLQFAVARKEAIQLKSEEPCKALSSPSLQGGCRFNYRTEMALRNHDLDLCKPLPSDQRRSCETQYIDQAIRFSIDETACEPFAHGYQRKVCLTKLAIYRLVLDKNVTGCDELDNSAARRQCRFVVTREHVKTNGDAALCEELGEPEIKRACIDTKIAYDAKQEDNYPRCQDILTEQDNRQCLLGVAESLIAKAIGRKAIAQFQSIANNESPTGLTENRQDRSMTSPAAPEIVWQQVYEDETVAVLQAPYEGRDASTQMGFRKLDAEQLGITQFWEFAPSHFFDPFVIGKGVASGDLNGDSWPDVVFATEDGVRIYLNTGGTFTYLPIDVPELTDKHVFVVAILDANNDFKSDLLVTTYGGENYLLLQAGRSIVHPRVIKLTGRKHLVTLAVGAGDFDTNGRLDFVFGNWSSGTEKLFSPEFSDNLLLMAEGDHYRTENFSEPRGETLSILVTDLNGDRHADLVVANDRLVPDLVYLGDGTGNFKLVSRGSGLIPRTSLNTMSVESADFNNDLIVDLFFADMSFAPHGKENYCDSVASKDRRKRCRQLVPLHSGLQSGDVDACTDLPDRALRKACFQAMAVHAAATTRRPQDCRLFVDPDTALGRLCTHLASPIPREKNWDLDQYLKQEQRNVLLLGDGDGFIDHTSGSGLEKGFWGWNAKAADLDNDGWQDLYIGTGFQFGTTFREIHTNVAFKNVHGKYFKRIESAWGLEDFINTPSYTYVDFDRDGDIDIIATGVLEAPRVYINQNSSHRSISFVLEDHLGNSAGIGTRLVIEYGDGQKQMREVKMSGGFMSFDHPSAHFGLGSHEEIQSLEIQWSTGQTSRITQPLAAGAHYRLVRAGRN